MKHVFIEGKMDEKSIEQLKGNFKGLTINVLDDEEKMEEALKEKIKTIGKENRKKELKEKIEKFLEIHAIDLKINGFLMPSYASVIVGDEYNDQNYYKAAMNVLFFDQNKKQYNIEMEIEYDGFEEEFVYGLLEELNGYSGTGVNMEEVNKWLSGEILELW